MKLRVLRLNVCKEWFDQIKAGTKTKEYRAVTPYNIRRIPFGFDEVWILLGYPKRGDTSRLLRFKWNGLETIHGFVHPHFKNVPTDVFAIDLSKPIP